MLRSPRSWHQGNQSKLNPSCSFHSTGSITWYSQAPIAVNTQFAQQLPTQHRFDGPVNVTLAWKAFDRASTTENRESPNNGLIEALDREMADRTREAECHAVQDTIKQKHEPRGGKDMILDLGH